MPRDAIRDSRICLHGYDFLIKHSPTGYGMYVRRTTDHFGERSLIGYKRSQRNAEACVMHWAEVEKRLMKEGRPSQLKKPRIRVVIEEE